jgi:uncharacterized SAM-binding protein YcdF (DUF218 family)
MSHSITSLLHPYTILSLLTALAIANLWRKRRETRRRLVLVTALFAALIILSTPAVGHLALRTLEGQFPPLSRRPPGVGAIVVLAGGVDLPDETGGPAELESDTIQRCLHAVQLYRQGTPCPVLVSGGKVDPDAPGPAFAEVMRDFLLQHDVRASDLLVEKTSRDTYENAVESHKLLEQHNVGKIVLVTDAMHMNRALGCFRKQGLEVVPAPCHFQAGHLEGSLRDYLPDPDAVAACQEALHEWLGTGWYWLWGRM